MEVSDDIAKTRKVDFQLRKLSVGGSGGRIRRSCVGTFQGQVVQKPKS